MMLAWTLLGSAVLFFCLARPAVCKEPHHPVFEVRLQTPITSFASTAGSEVRAVAVSPLEKNGVVVIPAGTLVTGRVVRVQRVGMGLVRERATIQIEFCSYRGPDGTDVPFQARVHSVDNAREQIGSDGRIKGVLAASAPQSLLRGVWRTPAPRLADRSLVGLTGIPGRVWTQYPIMGPFGVAGMFVARLALFRFPEPEISLPAGTDIQVDVISISAEPSATPVAPRRAPPPAVAASVVSAAHEVTRTGGRPAADIINVAFIGSETELVEAFAHAGWSTADQISKTSFTRTYRAVTRMSNYRTAPVWRLLYEGREPDLVFQKSLNTISKRHHIRIWRADPIDGRDLWLAAATHDVGISFDFRERSTTHVIDPVVDRERAKVVNDLTFAGCADQVSFVERPEVSSAIDRSATITDAQVAVVSLRGCVGPRTPQTLTFSRPHAPRIAFLCRRILLETRNYLLRDNVYHMLYRTLRWEVSRRALRKQPGEPAFCHNARHGVTPSRKEAVERAALPSPVE